MSFNKEMDLYIIEDLLFPTQGEFLPRVWWQREAEHRHGGDQQTRHDQVEEVVHRPPADLDCVGDVQVGLGTTVVNDLISFCWNTFN